MDLAGGQDVASRIYAEFKNRDQHNLEARLVNAARADQRLEAYFKATGTSPPPTHPGSPRMAGLQELPGLPPAPPPEC